MAKEQSQNLARAFWGPLIDSRFSGPAVAPDTLKSELEILEKIIAKARNSYLGIGRLPTEVLVSIFILVRDIWPPSRLVGDGILRFRSGWMAVTHVCSLWRNAALGAPSLWARHADALNVPRLYLPVILSRSRNCPLDIGFDFLTGAEDQADSEAMHDYDNILDRALSWLCPSVCRRTASITMNGFGSTLPQTFTSLGPHLHALRRLHMSTKKVPCHELPSSLASLSGITHLTLVGFYVPWNSPIFSAQLTYLALIFNYEDLERRNLLPSWSQLQALLHNTRSLRVLELRDLTPNSTSAEEIHLPQTLRLFGFELGKYTPAKFIRSLQLLLNLKFPETCARFARLCIHELERDVVLSDLEKELLGRCIGTFTTFGSCAVREILIGRRSIKTLTHEQDIRVWPRDAIPDLYEAEDDLHDRIRASQHYDGPANLAHLVSTGFNVCDFWESLDVRDLRVAIFTSLMGQTMGRTNCWPQFAVRAPHLRVIGVFITGCLPLLHSLFDVVDGKPASFPSLEVIVMNGVDGTNADEKSFIPELTALTSLVHLRKDGCAPLREMVVSKAAEAWGIWDSLKGEVDITFM